MILAAANCAEGKGLPPMELQYAWQCSDYSALPNAGGLRDQPVSLMNGMTACLNVWSAMKEYLQNNQTTEWVRKNPEKWKVIVAVMNLRAQKDKQEQDG